jgi:hypothetical protein
MAIEKKVNWTNQTVPSRDIIDGLSANGIILKPEDKQLIIDKVYHAIIATQNYKSNGCDCGQMWCPTCN